MISPGYTPDKLTKGHRPCWPEVCEHARAAFPLECCGYLVGPRDGEPDAIVRCTNAAASATAYAIDGAELVAFVRTLDTPRPARVLYHSHTNGRAYLSARDLAIAATDAGPIYPVDQLVVGITATAVVELARYAWDGDRFAEIARRVLG